MKRMFTNKQWALWLLCLLCAGSSLHAQDKLWGLSKAGGQDANGAIYRVNPASQTLDIMYSLKRDTANAGATPRGNFTEYNGLLYGLTYAGGSYSSGVLFSYNPTTNEYKALYDFDGTHGANPNGSLTVFNDKLYGTASNGGPSGLGVIFSFDPATNSYQDLMDLDGSTGYNPSGSLVVYNNALYGTAFNGGGQGAGAVFRFDPLATSNNITWADLSMDGTGGLPQADLVVYNGLLYGTATYGGIFGGGTIFSCTPDLSSVTIRHHFPWQGYWVPDGEGEGGAPTGSLVVYNNKLYGLTLGGIAGVGILYAFTPAADPANDVYEVKVGSGLGDYLYGNSLIVYNNLLYGMSFDKVGGAGGVLFSYAPGSSSITVLSDANGFPYGSLLAYNNSLWGMTTDGGAASQGQLFRFDLTTSQYQRKVSLNLLNVKNGGSPNTGANFFTVGSKLYGTADGGSYSKGVLFSYDRSAGIFSKLVDFDDSISAPTSMLYRDSVFYGVTGFSVSAGKGTLIRYDLRNGGALKKVANLPSTGAYGIKGNMAIVGSKIYMVMSYDEVTGQGSICELDTVTATLTKKYALNDAAGIVPYTGLVLGDGDVLYGQTGYGGQYGQGTLYSFDPGTGAYKVLYSLNQGRGISSIEGGDLIYKNGILYGLAGAAGSNFTAFSYDISGNTFTALYTLNATVDGTANGHLTLADNKLQGISYNSDSIWHYDLSNHTFGKTVGIPASLKTSGGANLIAISSLTQQISFNDTTVTYGKADFDPGATASSGLPITYTVEDEDIATVVNGKLHIVKAGTTVVTAAQPGSDDFTKAANVQRTLIIKPAPVQVIANDTTETYGKVNTTTFSVHYSGFGNNEDSTVLTTQPTVTTDATTDAHVRAANYTITPAGAAAANYTFTYVKGTLTIAPAVVTVKADDKQKLLGAADPAFTATATGFVNTTDSTQIMHDLVYALTATGNGKSDIVPSGLQSTDYTFTYVKGILTEDNTAFDPVTAKTYGDADFTLAARTLNGATPTFTGNNTAVATVATNGDVHITGAGTITFTAHFPAAGADPATTREQILTITPKALTVTAENKVMYTGDPLPDLTLQYSGFAYTDKATSLTTQPVASTTATAASPVGPYPIVVSGGVSNNYTFSYVSGTLTITNRPLTPQTITFVAIADKNYGDADAAAGATSDNATIPVTLKTSNSRVATIVNGNIHITGAGTVTITASQAADATHSAAKDVAQTFTVNKVLLTITADDKTKVYGAPVLNLTISYSGWVNNETVAVLTTVPVASVAATTTTPAGNYPITLSAAAADNYTFRYVSGTLVITTAQQTITFPAFGLKTYGDLDFSANATSTNSSLPIAYTSSNQAVATVSGNGTIHIVGAGTTSITAAQQGNGNYTDAVSISHDLTINKGALVITPDDKVRIQGQANPAFTFFYSGLKDGDMPADALTTMPVATTTANGSSYPGSYAIIASDAIASGNYAISYHTGTLKVIADTSRGADKLDTWMSSSSMLQANVFAVASQKATVELFSVYGQRVASQQVYLVKGTNTVQLPVGNIASGLYIVRVTGQYMQLSQKVRIDH